MPSPAARFHTAPAAGRHSQNTTWSAPSESSAYSGTAVRSPFGFAVSGVSSAITGGIARRGRTCIPAFAYAEGLRGDGEAHAGAAAGAGVHRHLAAREADPLGRAVQAQVQPREAWIECSIDVEADAIVMPLRGQRALLLPQPHLQA